MTIPVLLAATWSDGLFVFAGERRSHELPGQSLAALVPDGEGGALAIVGGHALCRRTRAGAWHTIVISDLGLACFALVGDTLYVGTTDAQVLRLGKNGALDPLDGFAAVPGRDTWYAGSAIVDGQVVGPPLGVRSMAATCDGAALLANVHVGGIPRSTDGGSTWHPTIAVASDVHEVCTHPTRPDVAVAAAAAGLCISRDGGATWTIEQVGLHAPYCSAVAFSSGDILVAASTDHFAAAGAVYRRPLDGTGTLQPIGGLPRWLGGIVDSGCIATGGAAVAIADKAGSLYVSADDGHSWLLRDHGLPMTSKLLWI